MDLPPQIFLTNHLGFVKLKKNYHQTLSIIFLYRSAGCSEKEILDFYNFCFLKNQVASTLCIFFVVVGVGYFFYVLIKKVIVDMETIDYLEYSELLVSLGALVGTVFLFLIGILYLVITPELQVCYSILGIV